jgi:hypothetical protein
MMASCAHGENESSSSLDILNLLRVTSKSKKISLQVSLSCLSVALMRCKMLTFYEDVTFTVNNMFGFNLFQTLTTEYNIDELENITIDIRSISWNRHHICTLRVFASSVSRPYLNTNEFRQHSNDLLPGQNRIPHSCRDCRYHLDHGKVDPSMAQTPKYELYYLIVPLITRRAHLL